jgi:hypothetical protein
MTTPTNSPVRAATSPELTSLRSAGQWSKLGLAIHHPVTVYTARINQTFATLDRVAQLTYDGGSGTLANVLVNHTVFIGSAAGLYDKGVLRVRATPTATILYISETSNVQFANDDYITVIDRFDLTQRDISVDAGVVSMDYDIEFGSYANGGVIPRIGPLASVINQTSGTITFTPPNPSLSAAYDGATVSSYLFEAPSASTTSNMTSATAASWTYPLTANQEYRWSCSITDSLGRTVTAYRRVFVNPTDIDFILETPPSADYSSGGWSFAVTVFDSATKADIYDQAFVVLYAKDYYNNTEGSIGKIAGYENIVSMGWIDGASIVYDNEDGSVTFTVMDAAGWLQKIRAMPFEIQNTASAATTWKEINDLTVDKALAHILFWTSTAPVVMDCFFTGDTSIIQILAQPAGTLYEQIDAISQNIFAKCLVNSYGQMYIEIDQQLATSAVKNALTVVMDVTTADYEAPLTIEVNTSEKVAMVELSGVATYDGVATEPLYSRAPGTVGERYGTIQSNDNYIFADQSDCNRLAGCLLAIANNDYEYIEVNFAQNNRLIDIAPRQWCTMSIAAGDTPRGITLSTARLIPRRVGYNFEDNVMRTYVSFEVEVTANDGILYTPANPLVDNVNDNYNFNDVGFDFPGIDDWFPPTVSPPVTTPCAYGVSNAFSVSWSPSEISGTGTLTSRVYFPCKLRSTFGGSSITIAGYWYGDAASNYTVYAIKNGVSVVSGSLTSSGTHYATWSFNPLSDTEIDGFEIALTSGIGSTIEYVPGTIVTSGSVSSLSEAGTSLSVTNGLFYSIESYAGPYQPQMPGTPAWESYMFQVDGSGRVGYNNFAWEGANSWLLKPTGHTYAEFLADGLHGRTYFTAAASSITYRVYDAPAGQWANNVGSLGYILRNAEARGRRIRLSNTEINNVCAI